MGEAAIERRLRVAGVDAHRFTIIGNGIVEFFELHLGQAADCKGFGRFWIQPNRFGEIAHRIFVFCAWRRKAMPRL